ncbi:MAG TPA: hypothetical protein VMF52_11650 [Steroidobacteraceae bacterium]|nr:hypothetical protein [Steroidobacteraceae bacterium]
MIGGLLAIAVPALADDEQPICARLAALADAASDGAIHQVRITWPVPEKPPGCKATRAGAERNLCRWLLDRTRRGSHAPISMSQDALECLGHPPAPGGVSDGGDLILHAWFTGGTWHPLNDTLAREHAEFTMEMDLRGGGPVWIQFTASPK